LGSFVLFLEQSLDVCKRVPVDAPKLALLDDDYGDARGSEGNE
jgi:hypothetical protein